MNEQIAHALKQAEPGTPVAKICRPMGISDATFCSWQTKYGVGRAIKKGSEVSSAP